MNINLSLKYNKIAAALLMLAPLSAANAAAPVFIENSVLNNQLEVLFKASTGNSEHLSLATNNENTVFTAFQDAVATKDAVLVSNYQLGTVTTSDYLSADATAAAAYTFPQVRVNPLDQSLVIGYIENGQIIVKTSNDGITWGNSSSAPLTGAPKIFKMQLDSQGNVYLLYANTLNKTELLKFDGTSWQMLLGPLSSKSTTVHTLSAGLAIDSNDKPIVVYRDISDGHKIKVASSDDSGVWQTRATTGASNAAYMEVAIDSQDNLHMMHVGFNADAGISVFKLDGSDPSDSTWSAVGNKSFGFSLAENYSNKTVGAKSFNLSFDSNDNPFVVFQQVNTFPASKKPMQAARLTNNVWTEIPYDLTSILKTPTQTTSLDHNFVDITVDSYDRPIVTLRSAGTSQDNAAHILRMNLIPGTDNNISFSLEEGQLSVGKLTVEDAESDPITLSLTGIDAALFKIDATGAISFRNIEKIIGADRVYNIVVNAADATGSNTMNVAITLINDPENDIPDTDGDSYKDNVDVFPTDPTEWLDTDGDGVGDNSDYYPNDSTRSVNQDHDGDGMDNDVDLDDDNDGVLDTDDAFPLNDQETKDSDNDGLGDNADVFPNDPTEQYDADGDGLGNNIDPNPNNPEDLTAPQFAQELAVITLDATGSLSHVEQGVLAQGIVAHDLFDGDIIATITTEQLILPSGQHTLTLSATDKVGLSSSSEVSLHIKPLVKVGSALVTEASSELHVPIQLSGVAPIYPATVNYLVTGPVATTSGTVTFDQDSTRAVLTLQVNDDAISDDQIVISFSDPTHLVLAENTQVNVRVHNENLAPAVALTLSQGGEMVSVIGSQLGAVTLSVAIADTNSANQHSVSFEIIDQAFEAQDNSENPLSLSFDPLALESGNYQVKVTVTETNTDELLSVEYTQQLVINSELTSVVIDSDQDGISDEFDTNLNKNQLPLAADEQPLEVLPGLSLSLGDFAIGNTTASVDTESTTLINDIHFEELSTISNFNIRGLAVNGESVSVVIPLAQDTVIPENAVYRKYVEGKGWFNFVEDEANHIGSAPKDAAGNCPAPTSTQYQLVDSETANGLIAGNSCIELTISDGGSNDGDQTVNGVVVDPGFLATELPNQLPEIIAYDGAAVGGEQALLLADAIDAENDDVSFSWIQLTGPTVTINQANSASASFTAPMVSELTTMSFEVTANDGRDSVTKEVLFSVTAQDNKPDADLGRSSGSFGWLMLLTGLFGLARRKIKHNNSTK